VWIRAWEENDSLHLSVSDNGAGFSDAALQNVHTALLSPLKTSDHVGIVNIHKRIMLTSGESYGLDIYSEPYKETRLTMTMPLHAADALQFPEIQQASNNLP